MQFKFIVEIVNSDMDILKESKIKVEGKSELAQCIICSSPYTSSTKYKAILYSLYSCPPEWSGGQVNSQIVKYLNS